MLAFEIQPTQFHFGLLLNITYQCGLQSPESMHQLLSPTRPDHLLFSEEKSNDTEDQSSRRTNSFLSAIDGNNERLSTMISTSDHDKQPTSVPSTIHNDQHESSAIDMSSEWWQDSNDIRNSHLLNDQLRPFSNAAILKPNISYTEANLVALRMPRSPAERLMLLGGIPGVLKHMNECQVSPNNIIFNSFLNVKLLTFR
jgi:hypothetical protein